MQIMSGHNKWTQIKHQKGAADVKKSKVFSMLGRQIAIEAKQANGDRSLPGLRQVIEKAKAANMPNDNIDRAIKNAVGGTGESMEEVTYEAYGPGGSAIIITGITDNKNRTSQEIKHLLVEHGGNLAGPGAALWAFTKNNEGEWRAGTSLALPEAERSALINLIGVIEAHDDIKRVYTNATL